MIDELMGLPAHPLIVHAAVIFGPLLVAAAVAYGLVPMLRKYLGWLLVGLAFVGPIALWLARLSGEKFLRRQMEAGAQGELLRRLGEHQDFGNLAAWWGTGLGVLSLALVYYSNTAGKKPAVPSSRAISYLLIAATVVLAALTAFYTFRAGHTGASIVWG